MAWRAWAPPCDHQWAPLCCWTVGPIYPPHISTFLGSVVQCLCGSCAMCRMPYCRVPVCVVCYCGQLCLVRPNDFLRTHTRGMLPCLELPGQPHFHTRSAHNECRAAQRLLGAILGYTGHWAHWAHWALGSGHWAHWALEQSNLLPGCPIDCHRAPQQCPPPYCSTEPNVLSARVLRWVPTVSRERRWVPTAAHPHIRSHEPTKPTQSPSLSTLPPFPILVQNPIHFYQSFCWYNWKPFCLGVVA